MHFLRAFADEAVLPPFAVQAGASRSGSRLRIAWTLDGDRRALRLAPPVAAPSRRDRLWEDTCFEAFVAPVGAGAYWELNVAASGDWNLYRFSGYREGMEREERVVGLAEHAVTARPEVFVLEAAFELGAVPELATAALDVGLAVVLATTDGQHGYRALHHPGSRPDFHHRDGFTLRLPAAP